MKSKVTIFSALAFLLGACSTGTYVTDRYDDIYFTPGDVPPPVVVQNTTVRSTDRTSNTPVMIMSEQNDEGTLKNYILETDRPSADAHYYDMEGMELIGSDTTVYENDREINYVINNYYDADDLDFSYRINRFHRYPYYSSYYWNRYYYDPFYYPYYSWGYYDPWYYDYWYGPSFGFGFGIGWYSPWYYSSWGYPYYSHWGYGHYHGGYYGGGYYGGGYYGVRNNDVRVGRRSTPSYDYSGTALGSGNTRSVSRSATTGTVSSTGVSRQAGSSTQSATLMERRRTTADTEVSSTGRRSISTTGTELNRGAAVGQTPSVRSTTVTGTENSAVRRATAPASTGTYQNRSTTTTQQKEYTPSYSKPRTVTRSTYNSSGTSSGSSYSKPGSSSSTGVTPSNSSGTNTRSTYQSGSSYSQGSSNRSTQTYSPPSNSSTSRPSSSYSPSSSGTRSSGSYSSGSVSSGSRSSSVGSSSSGSSSRSSGGSSGGRR
ncbi:hypothetical protein [Gaoshiqia sp. Z1-71]|uniref:hypothetical protein n=1 Tax=Gaoshiqia hydrogeniformans TaxID=3290090 RepID=UPI003BF77DDB